MTCTVCNRRKRVLIEFNGEDICDRCALSEAWWEVTRDGVDKEEAHALEVSEEHMIFTSKYNMLAPFITAVRAVLDLQDSGYDTVIPRATFDPYVVTYAIYKRDPNEILEVLKKGGIIKHYDDDQIILGRYLEKMADLIAQKRSDEAFLMLDGRISVVTLAKTSIDSLLRRVFTEVIAEICLDPNNNIETYEVTNDDLYRIGKRYNLQLKTILSKTVEMREFNMYFDDPNPKYKQITISETDDDGNAVTKTRDIRVWTIKESWVKQTQKVKQYIKTHSKIKKLAKK